MNRVKPIRRVTPLILFDVQQLPPAGWCQCCGREIYSHEYDEELELCPDCLEKEDEDDA